MKPLRRSPLLLSVLLVGLSQTITTQLPAQIFKTLYSFQFSEGAYPSASVTLSYNTLFVAPEYGGSANKGTVVALKADGSSATNLHSFTGADGYGPTSEMILSGNSLYGSTASGGSLGTGTLNGLGNGTIFTINTDGAGFTNLYAFTPASGSWPKYTNLDGVRPFGGLVLSDKTLYGVAESGGAFGNGVLFAININGTGFRNLRSFSSADGSQPNSLILSGDMLYGTTYSGTTNSNGTVFSVKTDGTGFKTLHFFSRIDGANPVGSLSLSGTTLFGTTRAGGSGSEGTVFRINTDGTGFTGLHSFNGRSEGGQPACGLVVWGNTLYGTTTFGIDENRGTIFTLDIDGTGFSTLYAFGGGTDGGSPFGRLLLSGNRLYGTTYGGGTANYGTVFTFDIVTPLSITQLDGNMILAWPTHPSGFTLQWSTNIASPVWNNVPATPVVVNGQNIVIEPDSGTPRFYRLSQ